jgi:hypothetical protein
MPHRFDAATLEALDRVDEIRIETTSLDGSTTHRTIIWVVTADNQVFIRSVRGTAGRWFREARQHPEVIIHAAGRAIPATAVLAADETSIQKVSEAYTEKYGRRSRASTASMLQPKTLETTMRLDPARSETGR